MDFSELIIGTFESSKPIKRDIEFRQRAFEDEWDNELVITEEQGVTEWRLNGDLVFQANTVCITYEHEIASELEFGAHTYIKDEVI